jgi:SAM-dependent methyltransferase
MARPDLSVVVPVWEPVRDLDRLIDVVRQTASALSISAEIIVCAAPSRRLPVLELSDDDVHVVAVASGSGYGQILGQGIAQARGRYVCTVDADFFPLGEFIWTMWMHRDEGEVLVGSRYVRGAVVQMKLLRRTMSYLLNLVYRVGLSLPYRDISSGFRMYRREVLEDIGPPTGQGLDASPELLVRAYCQGWRIQEVPIWYEGTRPWTRTRMLLRNSVKAADYDSRAFDSWVPLQRYWQRRRFQIIRGFMARGGGRVLDIGCGSSRIVQSLPRAVGMDLRLQKLRWLRSPGRALLQADMNHLPFPDAVFDSVVCSEVIEHIPHEEIRLSELVRVLAPGGTLILGTPDYSRRRWVALEWVYGKVFPGGYVKEHINHYTRAGLERELGSLGLTVLECRYVGGSEMIFLSQVPSTVPEPHATEVG